jgi:hypothetical protein
MPGPWRVVIVVAIGLWMLGTATLDLRHYVRPSLDNGLSVNFDGVVTAVDANSPAAGASIVAGDRIVPPLPRNLFREPPPVLSFQLSRNGTARPVTLVPRAYSQAPSWRIVFGSLYGSYLVFVLVGSIILLLRPSPMTWSFYLYCIARRWGDLWFYWPGSDAFFWANTIAFAALGGTSCVLVTIFALRFPSNRLQGWRQVAERVAIILLFPFAVAWPYVLIRVNFLGLPSQSLSDTLVVVTSMVYLVAAVIFVVTLFQSHGEERQRLRWILVFPAVLVLRVIAINQGNGLFPYTLPDWFPRALTFLAISVPIVVAYAVIKKRVFDVQFAISRALVYAAITTLIAGTFLLLDWFMSKQFAEARITLTAEVILALAIGSWLNMLHSNVDRFVDRTFFRERHLAEKRLAKAAGAMLHAESHEVVDRFLVHEPLLALDLTSAAIFCRDTDTGHFAREMAVGWERVDTRELTADDPFVLHLLAEDAPVRLADVVWPSERPTRAVGDTVLALPVLLRDELVAITLYGPHRSGADVDPDEIRSIVSLVERAGAAYDHIEARTLRSQVESLIREREAQRHEIEQLRASTA